MRINTPLRSMSAGVGAWAAGLGSGFDCWARTADAVVTASAAHIRERKINREFVIVIPSQDLFPAWSEAGQPPPPHRHRLLPISIAGGERKQLSRTSP